MPTSGYRVAVGFLARLRGLAFTDLADAPPGLLIPRCRSVHTFGMRFALDLFFMDEAGRVIAVRRDVPPRRVISVRGADGVLERPAGGGEPRGRLAYTAMLPEREELATIIVCEDDPPTLELLCDNLAADRYTALPAPEASDALRLCHYKQPDLLILDLGLPDAAGLDVLREVRSSEGATGRFDPRLPVIVLSGRGSEADRVRGFAEGADDYVVKPFSYAELVGRVRAVLRRRGEGRREGPRRVGDLVIDPATRRVTVGGEPVELANKEFVLLRALASEPTRVFTKQELLRDVWGYRSLGRTRTLDSHASRLRRKLCGGSGRYVVNCWGVGYRLIDA